MTLTDIYNSPDLSETGFTGGGDKGTHHTYIPVYERILEPYRNKDISLLEIGIAQGQSLKLWKEYFNDNSKILGVDVNPECSKYKQSNIDVIINYAHVPENYTNKTFDIIIDDGSHVFEDQVLCFNLLFSKHLNSGGIYIIEDIIKFDKVQPQFQKLHHSFQILDRRNLHYDYIRWNKDYKNWPIDTTNEPPIGHDDVMVIYRK